MVPVMEDPGGMLGKPSGPIDYNKIFKNKHVLLAKLQTVKMFPEPICNTRISTSDISDVPFVPSSLGK